MADCLSDYHAMSSTCSNEVEAPQTLESAEFNERFKQPLPSTLGVSVSAPAAKLEFS